MLFFCFLIVDRFFPSKCQTKLTSRGTRFRFAISLVSNCYVQSIHVDACTNSCPRDGSVAGKFCRVPFGAQVKSSIYMFPIRFQCSCEMNFTSTGYTQQNQGKSHSLLTISQCERSFQQARIPRSKAEEKFSLFLLMLFSFDINKGTDHKEKY